MSLDEAIIEYLLLKVDWSKSKNDTLKLKLSDVDKLKKSIYNFFEVKMDTTEHSIMLTQHNKSIISFYPGGLYSFDDCQALALQIKTRLNRQLQSELSIID